MKVQANSVAAPSDENASSKADALMQKIIQKSKALPPMPQILVKASEVLSNEDAGFKEIGDVLETDQAMATRVLRLANSAYYSLSVPVSSVHQASAILGFKTLFEMITVVSSSKMMGKRIDGYGIDAREVWKHSLFVALAAQGLAEDKFPEQDIATDAFMAGLIHDAGMLLLDPYVLSEKERFQQHMASGHTIQEAETDIFGFSHADIAAQYLKKWNLTAGQIHAICFHHHPLQSGDDKLSYILHVADAMANWQNLERNFAIEDGALAFMGIDAEEMEMRSNAFETAADQIITSMAA
ncbi:MAG: HDOD domain-containing protein [Thermodesulfobacteriota bacterium]